MIVRKKSPFTLIELLISLALMSLILSTLTYFFYQISILNRESEQVERNAFQLRYLENRLMDVIPKSIAANDKQKDFFFFTGTTSDAFNKQGNPFLVFTFDNCVNLVDPQFSNHVLGRIFLDSENNLSLAITPTTKRWQEDKQILLKREILMEGVDSLRFSFFVSHGQNSKTKVPFPNGSWIPDWKHEYNELPIMLKMEITYKGGQGVAKRIFVFPLPNGKHSVIYNQ